jgi:hypothetical protein
MAKQLIGPKAQPISQCPLGDARGWENAWALGPTL